MKVEKKKTFRAKNKCKSSSKQKITLKPPLDPRLAR